MRFIGCKNNLIDNIAELVSNECKDSKIFCDIFAGTGIVGSYFKDKYKIISNDLLYFSYCIQRGIIKLNKEPKFNNLSIISGKKNRLNLVLNYLNGLDISNYNGKKYISNRYSPLANRMYLTEENSLKIDYMRETIENWYKDEKITEDEYYYLIACMIQEVPTVSNISGTYGAYLKSWDNRVYKEFTIYPLKVKYNKYNNDVYNEDGVELLSRIEGDILYVDPPYNARQYLPNYHVLETVAKYDNPEVKGVTGVRGYDNQKSSWCLKTKVLGEFEKLVSRAKFKYIILSYNSEGLMKKEQIEEIMKKHGKPETFKLVEIPYRRFRSRSANAKHGVTEYLFFIEKDTKTSKTPKKQSSILKKINKQKYIKSPLNYTGGKYKILDNIFCLCPNTINNFYDILGGGFNVGINVSANKIIYNDQNVYLKEMFDYFKTTSIDNILSEIKKIIKEYNLSLDNRDGYNHLRDEYNKNPNSLKLFILTCFAFNHQIRFNNNHEFNTPFGKDRSSYNQNIENNLIEFVNKIQTINCDIFAQDFRKFKDVKYEENDLVYCDPPYLITTGSYNDGNRGFKDWGEQEEKDLLDYLDFLDKQKTKFILSNVLYHKGKENNLLIEWSKKYNIFYVDKNYYNCNYHLKYKDTKTVEVLITNFKLGDDNG